MSRFSYLPTESSEYLFCMICVTDNKERYDNFKLQKNNIPELVLYDAITPKTEGFEDLCSKLNFDSCLDLQKGRKALWLSNVSVFEYFLKSDFKYLVVIQDDTIIPYRTDSSVSNLKTILNYYVNHEEFDLGGTRLGQYASCNLYNKHCITNILDTIKKYPIDRGLDHYISNICDPRLYPKKLPFNFRCGLSNLPQLTKMDQNLSVKSLRLKYDRECR